MKNIIDRFVKASLLRAQCTFTFANDSHSFVYAAFFKCIMPTGFYFKVADKLISHSQPEKLLHLSIYKFPPNENVELLQSFQG